MTLGVSTRRPIELLEQEPTSAMAERDLFRGYSPVVVSRACACGGRIEALDLRDAIAEAVLLHNSSTAHSVWAIEHGWRHG
jgi:hypothetical protein